MKAYLPVLLIAALLLLTACGEKQTNSIIDPYIGGNLGLTLNLQNGMPPPAVFDQGKNPFGFSVVAQNVGEADIGPGTENPYMTVRLEGINPLNYGVQPADLQKTITDTLVGAKKSFDGTITPGSSGVFLFENLNYQNKAIGNEIETIRATVCYDYSNIAKTQICMKRNILENVQDATLCTLTGEKTVHNTGGPVQVTQVIENPMGPHKAQITFVVQHANAGNGEFYGRTATEDCDHDVRNSNMYRLEMEVNASNPNIRVTCGSFQGSNRGNLTLYSGQPRTMTCVVEDPTNTSAIYTDTLTFKTWYRYRQGIEQAIVIQAAP